MNGFVPAENVEPNGSEREEERGRGSERKKEEEENDYDDDRKPILKWSFRRRREFCKPCAGEYN